MSAPSVLRLFGVIHMDDPEKVTTELSGFTEDSDAIFIEYPHETLQPRDVLHLLLRVPMFFLGAAFLQAFIHSPLYAWFNRDVQPTELVAARTIAEDRDLPVHAVDDNPSVTMLDAGPKHVLANWLLFLPALALAPLGTVVGSIAIVVTTFLPLFVRRREHRYVALALLPLAAVGFFVALALTWWSAWLILGGMVVYARTLRASIDSRNDVMLERIQRLSAEHGYDDAVLVTGKGHLGGLADLTADAGIAIPTLHVSKWRKAGDTYADVFTASRDGLDLPETESLPDADDLELTPDVSTPGREKLDLPEAVSLPDGDDLRTTPAVIEGSETQVLGRRFVAAILDFALTGVFWFLCAILLALLRRDGTITASDGILGLAMMSIWPVIVVGYHGIEEYRRGMTLGKYLLGVVVVDEDGGLISKRAAFARNVLRPFGILLGYTLAGLTAVASSRNRTLGDHLGNTYVLRRAPSDDPDGRPDDADDTEADGDEPVEGDAEEHTEEAAEEQSVDGDDHAAEEASDCDDDEAAPRAATNSAALGDGGDDQSGPRPAATTIESEATTTEPGEGAGETDTSQKSTSEPGAGTTETGAEAGDSEPTASE